MPASLKVSSLAPEEISFNCPARRPHRAGSLVGQFRAVTRNPEVIPLGRVVAFADK
jgi:hypothetical protein